MDTGVGTDNDVWVCLVGKLKNHINHAPQKLFRIVLTELYRHQPLVYTHQYTSTLGLLHIHPSIP